MAVVSYRMLGTTDWVMAVVSYRMLGATYWVRAVLSYHILGATAISIGVKLVFLLSQMLLSI
jgi:hypothetical protein